jgi:hypothetical protein
MIHWSLVFLYVAWSSAFEEFSGTLKLTQVKKRLLDDNFDHWPYDIYVVIVCGVRDKIKELHLSFSFMDVVEGD